MGGQVLISQSTYDKMADILDVRQVLHVQMKGMPGDVALYDIKGIRGTYDVHVRTEKNPPRPCRLP